MLKKGVLGLFDGDDKEEQEQDIDELILNARVANYSFVNGAYSFSKGSVKLNQDNEENLLLNDPEFWKKVFKNQEEPLQKIQSEINKKISDNSLRYLE